MAMGSRRKAREFALKLLYQKDITDDQPGEISRLCWLGNRTDEETREFSERIFSLALSNQSEIDEVIRSHAQNWSMERMAVVDRCVLRLAIAELLYVDTPTPVVIDESIEIVRRYSTSESAEFVNGILDSVGQERIES
jgi:N utilization substance protein B